MIHIYVPLLTFVRLINSPATYATPAGVAVVRAVSILVLANFGYLISIHVGCDCTSGPGSLSRCLLVTHSRMNVLLIFVFFNNSGSSLSNAMSLAEMTAMTKVSRVGNPSSLRLFSTACEFQVRIDNEAWIGWTDSLHRRSKFLC